MAQVTLVGPRLADEGAEFVYRGPAAACEGCPYREQCLNLEEGVRYRVTTVREGGQRLDCRVHADASVVAVEVEPAPVPANVPDEQALAGNRAALAGPCPHTECPSHHLCEPAGADFETEYRVERVEGDPPHDYCHLDRELTEVVLAPDD
ncbi:MAG: UPF0179 family protein [Halobacteriaceae archaeon]